VAWSRQKVPAKVPKPLDPNKAVMAAPRLKPIETRSYGKGTSPMSSFPNTSKFGGGIGYGGPTNGGF
jgi:hypothetical protein